VGRRKKSPVKRVVQRGAKYSIAKPRALANPIKKVEKRKSTGGGEEGVFRTSCKKKTSERGAVHRIGVSAKKGIGWGRPQKKKDHLT